MTDNDTTSSEEGVQTRVGHHYEEETDVYAGRGQHGRHLLSVSRTGSRGWLGNPFVTIDAGGEHTREESIEKYRQAFEDKLKRDDEFRAAVRDLAGKTLGCWCRSTDEDVPACHADVVAEWADRLAAGETPDEDVLVTDGGQQETEADRDPFDGAIGMTGRPMDYGADDVQEPERDIESVTETLSAVEAGDNLKLGIGVDDGDGLTGGTMYPRVESVERDVGGFDVRLNLLHNVGDDGWGRLYITGYGNDGSDLDEWEIVSMPYHVPTETGDMRDFAAHGWVVGAEVDDAE